MNARCLSPVLCLLAALALAGPGPAGARPPGRGSGPASGSEAAARTPRPALPAVAAARSDGLADSVRRVHRRTGGQVLSAERVPYDGRDINRVKVVDDQGRVRVYMDDPAARPRRPPRPTRGNDD